VLPVLLSRKWVLGGGLQSLDQKNPDASLRVQLWGLFGPGLFFFFFFVDLNSLDHGLVHLDTDMCLCVTWHPHLPAR
jgi:hypothetical protein